MSDVVASLYRQGHRGKVLAFSRRGQLPRPNLSGDFPLWTLDYQRPQADTARGWLHRVRQEVALAAASDLPWQLVLDDIRGNGQHIWQRLSLKEQKRFLRHLRPWWDVHRYRIAPQVSAGAGSVAGRRALTGLGGKAATGQCRRGAGAADPATARRGGANPAGR
ncbi:Uncharacterized protein conserved in bacteria [Ewingella americana]|uniref:Uncharacterized protein conserved in bacteria n=1 Tax=Ewingella americana TaxID=41202 RepID=A0A377NGX5_9GAMM|nr:Uncharacterized protein conserved in bacteria [Ewingella americana]